MLEKKVLLGVKIMERSLNDVNIEISKYDNLLFPELVKLCRDRKIDDYFGKYRGELIKMLGESDKHNNLHGEAMAKEKDDAEEIEDDDIVIDDEESVTDKVHKKLSDDESDDDEIADDDEIVESDESDDSETSTKESKVGKKAVKDEEVKKGKKAVEKDDTDDIEIEEDESDEKAEEKPRKTGLKPTHAGKSGGGDGRGKRIPEDADAPYFPGSAGYCCYKALTKAHNNSMDKIVELADKMIAKAEAKPPKNTKAKVGIIMQELNSGKKDAKWGKVEKGDNGRYTFVIGKK